MSMTLGWGSHQVTCHTVEQVYNFKFNWMAQLSHDQHEKVNLIISSINGTFVGFMI